MFEKSLLAAILNARSIIYNAQWKASLTFSILTLSLYPPTPALLCMLSLDAYKWLLQPKCHLCQKPSKLYNLELSLFEPLLWPLSALNTLYV